jgi:hypothetical protein
LTHFDAFLTAVRECNAHRELLRGDDLLDPPNPDYGYHCTPHNALTFSAMGVDGVHTAILHDDGRVSDDSPVVYVCPMDSPSVFVIADSFLSYLADGCDVSRAEMAALLDTGGESLIEFVRSRFDRSRLLAEDRTATLDRQCGDAIHHRDL